MATLSSTSSGCVISLTVDPTRVRGSRPTMTPKAAFARSRTPSVSVRIIPIGAISKMVRKRSSASATAASASLCSVISSICAITHNGVPSVSRTHEAWTRTQTTGPSARSRRVSARRWTMSPTTRAWT